MEIIENKKKYEIKPLRYWTERKEEWIGIICAEGFRKVEKAFTGQKPGHLEPARVHLSETLSDAEIGRRSGPWKIDCGYSMASSNFCLITFHNTMAYFRSKKDLTV